MTAATTDMPRAYNLTTPPEGTWSKHATMAIPAIGTRVRITFNGLGYGTVVSYFMEAGYVGVAVMLEAGPAWRINQGMPDSVPALVFGSEIEAAPAVVAVTGRRDSTGSVDQASVMVDGKPLANAGHVNRSWDSGGFEWGYSGQGPRCLAYSLAVAYYQSRRKLAVYALAEDAVWAICPLVYNAGRGDLRITFTAIAATLDAAGLPS